MKEFIKKIIVFVYHKMQQNYLTFRVLVWFKEHGITRKVNFWVLHSKDRSLNGPTKAMLRSKAFFSANAERAEKMQMLLADEKSKIILGGGNSIQNRRGRAKAGILLRE